MTDKKHTRVIKRVIKPSSGHPSNGLGLPTDLGSSLNECLFDKNLAFAKYGKMIRVVDQFARMIQSVVDEHIFPQITAISSFATLARDIARFVQESCALLYGKDEPPDEADAAHPLTLAALGPAKEEHFQEMFELMRNSQYVRMIIQVCDKLVPYKTSIDKLDALSGHFLVEMPGISFMPFADFDIKDAYIQAANDRAREFILVLLNKLYTYGYKLYSEYTSPDMNVDQMVSVVRNAIEQLRKDPKLSRCDAAFDMIERSISMLNDNFGAYYTDFLQSRSSSTIFENFIIDVAKNSKAKKKSAVLAHQFNLIIGYYREAAAKSGTSKQAEMLFSRFSEFNSQLGVRNLGNSSAAPSASAAPVPAPSGKKSSPKQQ